MTAGNAAKEFVLHHLGAPSATALAECHRNAYRLARFGKALGVASLVLVLSFFGFSVVALFGGLGVHRLIPILLAAALVVYVVLLYARDRMATNIRLQQYDVDLIPITSCEREILLRHVGTFFSSKAAIFKALGDLEARQGFISTRQRDRVLGVVDSYRARVLQDAFADCSD